MNTHLQSAATSQLVGEPAADQPRSQRVWLQQLVVVCGNQIVKVRVEASSEHHQRMSTAGAAMAG